ncbi:hypothetical protein TH53_04740 [Pedobacter lusitanus]|uniref:DUF4890 domain-containing protein n=1 Tax=Pedobacter lusitanus TaxID=1503925 RepID=A0A0D0GQ89_9SPHI|nr:hypothetical protein [Pedobacter lusitanus]KIO78325.1 hypothetical protein TH53_04740 [Pedobacter lusitanus]
MKKSVLTLCMLLGMIIFAKAQKAPPTASEMATKSIEAMDKKLKLNSTQKNIIYNYTLDLCKEQVALSKKQQTGMYNEDDISKFYRMQNETTKNIRNILKGEQQTQYDQYIEEMLRGGDKKKKKGKHAKDEEEVVTGIDGLKLPPPANP